jgi:hypothetical protein
MTARQLYTEQTFKILEDLLYARRSGRVAREQNAYERLESHCRSRGVDFLTVLRDGPAEARRHNLAITLNGA